MGKREPTERGKPVRPATLDQKLFDRLAEARGRGLISILLPTHIKGPETAQDRIRLKNALTEVDDLLTDGGWRRTDREQSLSKARGLLTDDEFWAHQGQGLAMYIDDGGDIVPVAVSEELAPLTCVAESYHVRHLLPELLLAPLDALVLTKGSVALFSVDTRVASPVDADLPSSMDDANWFMDREAQLQNRANRTGATGMHHGHDPSDRMDEDVQRFLRAVAEALPSAPDDEPLVVLGDDPVIDLFRGLCRREVIGVGLDGSERADSAVEVQRRVGPIIDKRLAERLDRQQEAAEEALGTTDTVTMFPDALQAAVTGRLAKLFLHHGADPVWGHFDPETLEARAGADRVPGTVDLLDRLAVSALATGAEVLSMRASVNKSGFVGVRRF
jgi:hypothetical protein